MCVWIPFDGEQSLRIVDENRSSSIKPVPGRDSRGKKVCMCVIVVEETRFSISKQSDQPTNMTLCCISTHLPTLVLFSPGEEWIFSNGLLLEFPPNCFLARYLPCACVCVISLYLHACVRVFWISKGYVIVANVSCALK